MENNWMNVLFKEKIKHEIMFRIIILIEIA